MTQTDRIGAARALLANETPLKGDCGKKCAAACCAPDADGRGGMLLFPGEEALYDPCPDWATLEKSPVAALGRPLYFLTCEGRCPRDARPLACRVFPLTPVASGEGVSVEMDVRAWPVCPLTPHGLNGLSAAFVEAVRTAAALLFADDACRDYIKALTAHLESHKHL